MENNIAGKTARAAANILKSGSFIENIIRGKSHAK